jgi:hypothetical protein
VSNTGNEKSPKKKRQKTQSLEYEAVMLTMDGIIRITKQGSPWRPVELMHNAVDTVKS